jgi:hypothetical protein
MVYIPAEVGWDMYDPRSTIKAEAAEAITAGYACYIHTDGKAYLDDNSVNNQVHGVALIDAAVGELVTLVTHGRLYTTATQTIGNKAKVSNQAGGGLPSTAGSGTATAGFAIDTYLIMIHIEPQGNNS